MSTLSVLSISVVLFVLLIGFNFNFLILGYCYIERNTPAQSKAIVKQHYEEGKNVFQSRKSCVSKGKQCEGSIHRNVYSCLLLPALFISVGDCHRWSSASWTLDPLRRQASGHVSEGFSKPGELRENHGSCGHPWAVVLC